MCRPVARKSGGESINRTAGLLKAFSQILNIKGEGGAPLVVGEIRKRGGRGGGVPCNSPNTKAGGVIGLI